MGCGMVDAMLEGVHCFCTQEDRDATYLKHPTAVGVFDGLIGYCEGEGWVGLGDDGAPDAGGICNAPEKSISAMRAIADTVRRPARVVKKLFLCLLKNSGNSLACFRCR